MQSLSDKTVREIALEMPITTRVFEKFKIDYCCRGHNGFADACRLAGADPALVAESIEQTVAAGMGDDTAWLNGASLRTLIGYIVDKHHVFTRDEIASLTPLMAKVASRHGERHPELIELATVYNELCDELMQHLLKEEQILFPYVEKLERSESPVFSCFGTVHNPIRMMLSEHDSAGGSLRRMRELTNDYALPEGACPSYAALFHRLEGFERDLHRHIHLENNLLFPKAIELEERTI